MGIFQERTGLPNNTDRIKVPGAHADNCRSHFCQSCLHCVAKLGNGMFLQDHTMPWQSFFSVKLSKRKQSNSTAEQWDAVDPVAGAVQLRSTGPYPCRASQEPRVGTWQGEERGRYRQQMELNNFILNPGTVQNQKITSMLCPTKHIFQPRLAYSSVSARCLLVWVSKVYLWHRMISCFLARLCSPSYTLQALSWKTLLRSSAVAPARLQPSYSSWAVLS